MTVRFFTAVLGAYPQVLLGRALATISEGALITDADQNVVYVNDALTAITGYSHDEMLAVNCRILRGPGPDRVTIDRIRDALSGGEVFHGEVLNFRKNGTSFWFDLTVTLVKDEAGKITHFVNVQRDITLEKELAEQVYFLAHHDPDTGLPNRNALELQLFEAVGRATEAGGATAVGIIDLDDFRVVNTSFDHDVGDEVIAETAWRLQGWRRPLPRPRRFRLQNPTLNVSARDCEQEEHQSPAGDGGHGVQFGKPTLASW